MEYEYKLRDGQALVIYDATHADAREIVEYMKVVGAETDFLLADEFGIPGLTEATEKDYIDMRNAQKNSALYVGRIGAELVTMFGVNGGERPRNAHNAEIGLSVLKKYWHIGAGSAVMETCLNFAVEAGLKSLTLTVRADNYRAQALYTRFGFHMCGCVKSALCVRGEYFDEYMMQREV